MSVAFLLNRLKRKWLKKVKIKTNNLQSFVLITTNIWHCWFIVSFDVVFYCLRRMIKKKIKFCWGAEERTNGDFLIRPTCYFCWVLRHTRTCAHTNTHNSRNVSRRFECQGFPLFWPDVRAAAGLGCVLECKEMQGTSRQILLQMQTNSLSLSCGPYKNMMWYTGYNNNYFLDISHKNWNLNRTVSYFCF